MTRRLGMLLVLGAVGCVSTNVRPMIFPLSTAGRSVAVFPFADLRDPTAPDPLASPSARLRAALGAGLARQGYSIIDPTRLDALIAEQVTPPGAAPTDDEVLGISRTIGVQAALVGTVVAYDRPVWPKARLNVVLRLVDVARGNNERVLEVTIEKSNVLYPPNLHDDVVDLAVEQILAAIRMGG